MKETILKYALKNALDFGGKVNPKVVLGLTLKEKPELRSDVPAVMQEINTVIKEIEGLSQKQLQLKLQESAPELLLEKEEVIEGPLKPLPNAEKGKVKVRIAPSPSGPLHIGHAYGVSLNYAYAKMYDGQLLLRIEDTNPEKIYPKAYELIEDDVKWLTGNNVAEVVIQSSRLGVYYDHAEKLVDQGRAYVCLCDADEWRELKNAGKACPCREIAKNEQQLRFAKMFNEYAEGEAVLRLKSDIKHKNPAMRDFAIMRIVEHIHPKTGKEQRVWPLMVFSVAIDDHELGITHVLNGKDQMDNAAKERLIMDYFGWGYPEYRHWGKINFTGFRLKTSEVKVRIEQKEYVGWDDIKLPFMAALRRRGYQPGAFHAFAVELGLSLNDKKVDMDEFWKLVNAFNKDIVEPKANRYFVVEKPQQISIEGFPPKEILVKLHPDFLARGTRKFTADGNFYVSEADSLDLLPGRIHRLMDCANFTFDNGSFRFVSWDYNEYKDAEKKGKIIHWLPAKETVPVEIIHPEGVISGRGERSLSTVNVGEVIQLERMFFARIDMIQKQKIQLWYLHT